MVGPASAPLPLFYALSQAGRAIAAAHCPDKRWDYKGHGLDVTVGSTKIGSALVRPDTPPNRGDAYSVVADSTGSDTLAGPVELSALWASIPDLPRVEGLGHEFPSAIYLSVRPRPYDTQPTSLEDAVIVGDEAALPHAERDAALTERLAAYPAAKGCRVAGGVMVAQGQVGVTFPADDGNSVTDVRSAR